MIIGDKIMSFLLKERMAKKEMRVKTHYECCVCGDMLAPYFLGELTPTECGWKRIDRRHWLCHQCFYHYYAREKDREKSLEPTWEQWQEEVEVIRKETLAAIKEKDREYYEKHFATD